MKSVGYIVAMLLVALSIASRGQAQGINEDSLQREILKSLDRQLDEHKIPKSFFDTSKIPSSSFMPIDFKKFFESVNKEISAARSAGDIEKVSKGYGKLSSLDSIRGNYRGAYENYKLFAAYRDSLQKKEFEKKELQARMQREFDRKQAQQQIEKEKEHRRNSIRQILLFAVILAFVTISATFFVAYKRERKGKNLIHVQKKEIENTLSELKSTQAQLIQSEKMASLGVLTAGIAHEIQNPLNFVNNFSEVSHELIGEMKQELATGNMQQANEIADDLEENLEKINHHGKRADAIVKGMLQHSRASSGQKEITDINALADEYLRLAYHGLRAKDKSFNTGLKTDFDPSIGKINIVPEDIGRVLLNLINNAFYAVNEKSKQAIPGYEPAVVVSTKKSNNKVEIRVKDNGNGIPGNIIDKIFNPFFTTKPTGQGTGLGLSLAYDIVKAHGGEIKVETNVGEGLSAEAMAKAGSQFVILLPLN
jgi:signal transduction histidine kinase